MKNWLVAVHRILVAASCLVLLLFSTGCMKIPVAEKKDDSSEQEPVRKLASPLEKVNIDDVLARTDYPPEARAKFEKLKESGRTEIIKREVEETIRVASTRKEDSATMEVTTSRGVEKVMQPSLSVLKDPPPFKYPRKASNAWAFYNGKADYIRIGVDHFLGKEIFKLSKKDQQATADFMNSVLDGPKSDFNREVWTEILDTGNDLLERLPLQLKTEPMFNMCLAIAESETNKRSSAKRRLDAAIKEFTQDDYPSRMPVYAMRLQNEIRSEYRPRLSYKARVAAIKHWITKDFRARGMDERYAIADVKLFVELALLNRDYPALDEFTYILETSRTLPPWFKEMATAEYHYDLGYHFRGTGMANTVSEKGWEELEKNSVIAHKHYENALKANPMFPEAGVGLMMVSRVGHSDKSEEFWFEKAIEHEVDYMLAYQHRLRSLMPRWGGSVDEMLAFAKKHAAKKQYDTSVPFILPHLIFYLRNQKVLEHDEHDKLTRDQKLLGEVITALEGLAEHNENHLLMGSVRDKQYLQTLLALFQTRAGRVDDAENLYRQHLRKRRSPLAIEHYGYGAAGSLESLAATATAFNAEYGDEAKRLQDLMGEGVEQRLKNFDAIEELVGYVSLSDQSGGLYFERMLNQVRKEKAFDDGELIDIEFDEDMNMWSMSDDRQLAHVSKNSATFNNSVGNRMNQMVHVATCPGPKMIEMTITFPEKVKGNPHFAPGFSIGGFNRNSYTVGFSITGDQASNYGQEVKTGLVYFGINSGAPIFSYRVAYRDNKCKLKVLTEKNWIEVYTDDQFLFRYRNPQLHRTTNKFVILANAGTKATGTATISDCKMQKWIGAPPETSRKQALLKHYQKVYDADPDDMWNQFWLGHALHDNGKLEDALALYKEACENGVNKQIAGFYIGDILDRQGKRKEAFDWYVESALGTSDGGPQNIMYAYNPNVAMTEPLNWSCFRIQWLQKTCGFELDTSKAFRPALSNYARAPHECDWLKTCLFHMPIDSLKDNADYIESKIKGLERLEKKTPQQYKEIPALIRESLEEDGKYVTEEDTEPLYLRVKVATPFFRRIDQFR